MPKRVNAKRDEKHLAYTFHTKLRSARADNKRTAKAVLLLGCAAGISISANTNLENIIS